MVKLILVRHGYSTGNKEKKFTGQMDAPLTEEGVKQAIETADYVVKNYKVDKIYSSDLSRAVATAELVSKATGVPVILDKNLRELDVGFWQNKTFEEVRSEFPNSCEFYKNNTGLGHPDGGEKYSDFRDRVKNAVIKIAKENQDKTVLVSTHGGTIRGIICGLKNTPLDQVVNTPIPPNSSVTVVEYDNDKWNFTLVGYTDHLTEKATEFKLH